MRNFDGMRTMVAGTPAQTFGLCAVSGIVVSAQSAHRTSLASRTACRQWRRFRVDLLPHDPESHLVKSAGLTLMGYSDTSGAPSADLRR